MSPRRITSRPFGQPGSGKAVVLALSALLASSSFAQSAAAQHAERGEEPASLDTEPPPPPRILERERAARAEAARAHPGAPQPSQAAAPAARASAASAPAAANGGAEGRPQGDDTTAAPPPTLGETPFQARLAPAPEDRSDDLEEVIVVGQGTALHLPDLGSSLRSAREAERDQGRIRVTFLPLYDPNAETGPAGDSLFGNREMQRVGFINLFRIRFGPRREE